jgi:hypothetical protein
MDLSDFGGGLLAAIVMVGFYAAYLAIIFAFIWAVWNWIIVPTVPYIMGAI